MTAANPRLTRHPAPIYPGISDSVRVSAGDLLYVSGVVGLEDDGTAPDDFARAVELAYTGLERALARGGARLTDIVRVGVYITRLDQERLGVWRAVRDRFLPDELPASTLIGVHSLVGGAQIEVDAVAAL
ncbi:RidA family protein [Microbacterium sp. TNHR37B]|uniref:RidA family protein n=1 Tax=Microbacterium sp. TNHR37B TaxID=1775956 RepID=UPI0007B25917|nr:RidA family protein [Microbacterium sp. TNHR37B]KZE91650.1 RutC family protein YjgH [Microbacterium sp. TNHR37B]